MRHIRACLNTLAVIAAACASAAASATPIVGTANLTLGQIKISNGSIDWNNNTSNNNPPPNGSATTYGAFAVQQVLSGSFAALPALDPFSPSSLSLGLIRDLADPAIIPGDTGNAFPIGVQTHVSKFIQFNAKPHWIFDATFLVPGTSTLPFTVTASGQSVGIEMVIQGLACDDLNTNGSCDASDDLSQWTGTFSANYTNTTLAELTTKILTGGTLDNNTWRGSIEATQLPAKVPEPASLALVGLAIAALGLTRRRTAA